VVDWFSSRVEHFYTIVARRRWQILFTGIFGILAGLFAWRDELLTPERAERYKVGPVIAMLPHWNLGAGGYLCGRSSLFSSLLMGHIGIKTPNIKSALT
jgi:hypothetical protein